MAEQEEQSFDDIFDTVTSYTTEASDDACEDLETTSTNDPEQMTPPAKRKKIGCAYNDAWKKSYPWSKAYPAGGKHYAWCTYCSKSVNIKAGSNELRKHSLTKTQKK